MSKQNKLNDLISSGIDTLRTSTPDAPVVSISPMSLFVGVMLSVALFSGGVAAAESSSSHSDVTTPEAASASMITMQSAQGFICKPPGDVASTGSDWSTISPNGNLDEHRTFLGSLLQTFLSFISLTGVPVFIVLYQLDGILEFFALGADTKQAIKQHQRNLWIAAAKVYVLPALIYFTLEATEVTAAQCIELVAWL